MNSFSGLKTRFTHLYLPFGKNLKINSSFGLIS